MATTPFVGRVDGGPRSATSNKEPNMTEYLIAANEEWVPDYSEERMQEMSQAVKALRAEMKAAGVYVFLGGLDNSAGVQRGRHQRQSSLYRWPLHRDQGAPRRVHDH
jgi:hypothetical protein